MQAPRCRAEHRTSAAAFMKSRWSMLCDASSASTVVLPAPFSLRPRVVPRRHRLRGCSCHLRTLVQVWYENLDSNADCERPFTSSDGSGMSLRQADQLSDALGSLSSHGYILPASSQSR